MRAVERNGLARLIEWLQTGSVMASPSVSTINAVVPAGIAGTPWPWRAVADHLPVVWIPAIPAGMTVGESQA
jgi:hypothetical protein